MTLILQMQSASYIDEEMMDNEEEDDDYDGGQIQ